MATKCGQVKQPEGYGPCVRRSDDGHLDCIDKARNTWTNPNRAEQIEHGPMSTAIDRRTPWQKKQAIKESVRNMKPEPRAGLIDFDGDRGSLSDALRRVDANADEAFRVAARDALRDIAHRLPEFTSEDVLDIVTAAGITTHENRAMGPVMNWGKAQGLIAKSDPERFTTARAGFRHQMPKRIWVSLVYAQPGHALSD